jgi:hypothetical protein
MTYDYCYPDNDSGDDSYKIWGLKIVDFVLACTLLATLLGLLFVSCCLCRVNCKVNRKLKNAKVVKKEKV